MDGFEQARLKGLKRQERNSKILARHADLEKREQPKVEKPMPVSIPQVMEFTVTGPVNQTFKVYYGGTILSSQMADLPLKIKKQLAIFGRVE
jgi:hypothetical protein